MTGGAEAGGADGEGHGHVVNLPHGAVQADDPRLVANGRAVGENKTDVEDRLTDIAKARTSAIVDVIVNILLMLMLFFIGFGTLLACCVADIFIAVIPSKKLGRPIMMVNMCLSLLAIGEGLLWGLAFLIGQVTACFVGNFCWEWWNFILLIRVFTAALVVMWKFAMFMVMFHAIRALGKPKLVDHDQDIKIGKYYAAAHLVCEVLLIPFFFWFNALETVVAIAASAVVVVRWMQPGKIPFTIQVVMLVPIIVMHLLRAMTAACAIVITGLVTGGSIFDLGVPGMASGIALAALLTMDVTLFVIRLVACAASVFALEELFKRKVHMLHHAHPTEAPKTTTMMRRSSTAREQALRRRASLADSVDMSYIPVETTKADKKKKHDGEVHPDHEGRGNREIKALDHGVHNVVNDTGVNRVLIGTEPGDSSIQLETKEAQIASNDSLDVLKRGSPSARGMAAVVPAATAEEPDKATEAGESDTLITPGGWVAPTASEQGNTRQEKPAAEEAPAQANATASSVGQVAGVAMLVTKPKKKKPTWKEYKADDGTPYYYNRVTKETTWEKPVDMDEAPPA